MWHLSGSLAYEVEQFGIEVGIVVPGGYKTDWQTDSLWVTEQSRNGDSPYGTQTHDTLEAFRGFAQGWPEPDDYARRMAGLVDAPEIPFWTMAAREDHQDLLNGLGTKTFEEQRVVVREAFPGYAP